MVRRGRSIRGVFAALGGRFFRQAVRDRQYVVGTLCVRWRLLPVPAPHAVPHAGLRPRASPNPTGSTASEVLTARCALSGRTPDRVVKGCRGGDCACLGFQKIEIVRVSITRCKCLRIYGVVFIKGLVYSFRAWTRSLFLGQRTGWGSVSRRLSIRVTTGKGIDTHAQRRRECRLSLFSLLQILKLILHLFPFRRVGRRRLLFRYHRPVFRQICVQF